MGSTENQRAKVNQFFSEIQTALIAICQSPQWMNLMTEFEKKYPKEIKELQIKKRKTLD